MNKRQQDVQKALLQNEKRVLDDLKKNYESTLNDIRDKIERLQADQLTQSKIYQIEYQEMLERQIQAYIDILAGNNYSTINEYMQKCYEDGFIGTIYDLHGQDVNIMLPISQDKIIRSIQKSADGIKLSDRLYSNSQKLKIQVKAEITRGLSNGYSYLQIANSLSGYAESNRYQAYRIARTEGHRISQEATFEAQQAAKDKGADVVKQWSSAMDTRTRDSHMRLDQEVRELEDPFDIDGNTAMHPGGFGVAAEDINCRCVLLQRARWALSDDEIRSLENAGKLVKIDAAGYNEFKEKYKTAIDNWANFEYIGTDYQSKKEMIDHLLDEYNIMFRDSRKYPMDVDLMRDSINWLDKFNTYFSSFAQKNPCKIPVIDCKTASKMKNTVGYYSYYPSIPRVAELALNGQYHSNVEEFSKYVTQAIQSKWYPENATLMKTFVHEYGHHVSNSLKWCTQDQDFQHKFIQECLTEYKQIYDKDLDIGNDLSRYAKTNESELFAEAFAEYFGGENPRDFAAIFGKKLEQVLKGVK